MSFDLSCRNIRLDGSTLYAACRRVNGSYVTSSLELDTIIGNINGVLKWGHKNFSLSAKNVRLEDHVLKADLRTLSGSYIAGELQLGSNISNIGGMLKIVNVNNHPIAQGSDSSDSD
ncbi:MAG: hypothetical protein Q9213_001364 [Squamulea squamosa]